ncbi:MAG TPA: replication-relaxation family protein [Chitinophagaceae bacterium]|nr:replication-relaxation family protein [Chitinophagaceae bacterium]
MEILLNLDKLDFLTTSQIQRLHNLGGRRNAQRILKDMQPYLHSFTLQENVHYLSSQGRQEVGSTKIRRRSQTVAHTLLRNEVYIAHKPKVWKAEMLIKWHGKKLQPDALYEANRLVFLEIDRTQSMAVNRERITLYHDLKQSGLFQKQIGEFPIIQFVTLTAHRQKELRALIDHCRLKGEVLLASDL